MKKTKKSSKRRWPPRQPDEFYVLLKAGCALSVNWAGHGKKGVYLDEYEPEPGDRIIKVREVLPNADNVQDMHRKGRANNGSKRPGKPRRVTNRKIKRDTQFQQASGGEK